jgi:hypothetical protein
MSAAFSRVYCANGYYGCSEWRTNPQLDAHVRQQMTELLAKKADLAAMIIAAERAQRTRPLLHPEMGKLYASG